MYDYFLASSADFILYEASSVEWLSVVVVVVAVVAAAFLVIIAIVVVVVSTNDEAR